MKQPGFQFLILGIVLLVIVSACAGRTVPTPTPAIVPPTLAPTLPALTPTTVSATLAPTVALPTLAPATDGLALITAFQDAYDKRDVDGLVALFVDNPTWGLWLGVMTRLSPSTTTEALRNIALFQFELNTQLDASDCSTTNDKATCTLVITDDCKPPTLDAYHIRTQFAFKDAKISEVIGRWDAAEVTAYNSYDSERALWARDNLPEDTVIYNDGNQYAQFNGGTPDQGIGKLLSAIELGQATDRICKGYTEAGH